MEDLDKMEELCYYIKENSLCAVWARQLPTRCCPPSSTSVTSMIAHIKDKTLSGRRLQGAARSYDIDPQKCRGCTLCATVLPGGRHYRHRQGTRM